MELGNVVLIGGGHMGQAICGGLISTCGIDPEQITIAEPAEESRTRLHDRFGVHVVADAVEALPADTIIIAVRPNVVAPVCQSLAAANLSRQTLVISIAAGVSTASIANALGRDDGQPNRLVRIMPNAPLAYGAGIAGVNGAESCPDDALQTAMELFESLGGAVHVTEELQNVVTAVSGSGPAYFELAVAAMARGAEQLGMSYEDGVQLALQTMYGTAVMLKETKQDPADALEFICTKGGTTEAALDAMRALGIEEAFAAGVRAAAKRSHELGI